MNLIINLFGPLQPNCQKSLALKWGQITFENITIAKIVGIKQLLNSVLSTHLKRSIGQKSMMNF